MSCFDKDEYKALKSMCDAAGGIHIYTEKETENKKFNGISVAFAPTLQYKEGRMLEVAVSFCSPEDKYKKKHGKYHAMRHFCRGATIQLPMNDILQTYGPEYTGSYLVGMFSL